MALNNINNMIVPAAQEPESVAHQVVFGLIVETDGKRIRLEDSLSEAEARLEMSREFARKLIKSGKGRVNASYREAAELGSLFDRAEVSNLKGRLTDIEGELAELKQLLHGSTSPIIVQGVDSLKTLGRLQEDGHWGGNQISFSGNLHQQYRHDLEVRVAQFFRQNNAPQVVGIGQLPQLMGLVANLRGQALMEAFELLYGGAGGPGMGAGGPAGGPGMGAGGPAGNRALEDADQQ